MKCRITYWKTLDGKPTCSYDFNVEEYQDLVENATISFIAGVTAAPYRAFPCDDGHEILQLELWEDEDWRMVDCDEINDKFHQNNEGKFKVDYQGFEAYFENPDEDFMAGLQYFQERVDHIVTFGSLS